MAYTPGNLRKVAADESGSFRLWVYKTTDAVATVNTAGYFADATIRGVRLDDVIMVIDTDDHAVNFVTLLSATDVSDGLAIGVTDTD